MLKILVVEDELAYANLLHKELTQKGYQVFDAANGAIGLKLAVKYKPDLILLDIRMPQMDGMTMLHALRKDPYGAKAKVIMLTNFEPDNSIIGKLVKDAPTYYCVKSDTSLDDLMEKITSLLGESSPKLAAA
jgi:DNA-binding response OmpR family regulator